MVMVVASSKIRQHGDTETVTSLGEWTPDRTTRSSDGGRAALTSRTTAPRCSAVSPWPKSPTTTPAGRSRPEAAEAEASRTKARRKEAAGRMKREEDVKLVERGS